MAGGSLLYWRQTTRDEPKLASLPNSDCYMWTVAIPIWEFVLRGAVVYIFLLVLLRLTGKRQIGQLATFDLVLLLVLSNAVQNSMNGGDSSLVGGTPRQDNQLGKAYFALSNKLLNVSDAPGVFNWNARRRR